MSQAESLLNTLNVYEESYNNDSHIIINADRTITVPEILKSIAVQYDNNVETVTFDCPRYWDGHDFYGMNVYVNYMRSDGHKGSYAVKNVSVDENDRSMIHFDWTITDDATMASGKLSFLVCINDIAAENKPHWNSRLNQELVVENGMEVHDQIVENNPMVIEEILLRLNTIDKERTHWVELVKDSEIFSFTDLTSDEPGNFVIDFAPFSLIAGETYSVNWKGKEYVTTAIYATESLGEPAVILVNDGANTETFEGTMFVIICYSGTNKVEIRDPAGAASLSVSVHNMVRIVHKIPEEFIPDSIASKDYVHAYVNNQLGVIENGYY